MKVHKVGNSLMVTIPASVARRLSIADGDVLEMEEHEGELVLKPRPPLRALFERWAAEPIEVHGPRPTREETVAEIRAIRERRHQ